MSEVNASVPAALGNEIALSAVAVPVSVVRVPTFPNSMEPVPRVSMEPPPADVAARLDRFAAGEADAAERGSVASMLKEHPEWVRYLAGAIRKRA